MTREDKLDINYSLVADIASGTAGSVRIRKFAEYITDLENRVAEQDEELLQLWRAINDIRSKV